MEQPAAQVYEAPTAHGAISALIRRHSTNRVDVRAVALEGIRIDRAERLLDLGCGFGFMAEALAERAGPGVEVVGVDINAGNRARFLEAVERAGAKGRFVWQAIDDHLDFPPAGFDGATASYSLYFFPGAVGDVARILRHDACFVAVTHSEVSLRSLLRVLGLPLDDAPHVAVLRRFSAETGSEVLCPHFEQVERRDYPNRLVFLEADLDEFLLYTRFKLPLIMEGMPVGAEVPGRLVERARAIASRDGRIDIDKRDEIFVCSRPVRS